MNFPGTSEKLTAALAKAYYAECRAQPKKLTRYDMPEGHEDKPKHLRCHTVAVWRSQTHLATLWQQGEHQRLTFQRTAIKDGQWQDGMTWDELMRLKEEIGYGDCWAVEVFPPTQEVVNVTNMRHLFLLDAPPPYAWTTP